MIKISDKINEISSMKDKDELLLQGLLYLSEEKEQEQLEENHILLLHYDRYASVYINFESVLDLDHDDTYDKLILIGQKYPNHTLYTAHAD